MFALQLSDVKPRFQDKYSVRVLKEDGLRDKIVTRPEKRKGFWD